MPYFILVIAFGYGSTNTAIQIPFPYSVEQECKDSGAAAKKQMFFTMEYVCVKIYK